MFWVKLFKPTWGRIAIFIILFAAFALLDQQFLFFPESPLTYNLFGSGAVNFVIFILIVPYILSCIIPAVYIKEFRHAKLHEFTGSRERDGTPGKKPVGEVMEDIEDYEEVQESYARSLRKPLEKPAGEPIDWGAAAETAMPKASSKKTVKRKSRKAGRKKPSKMKAAKSRPRRRR